MTGIIISGIKELTIYRPIHFRKRQHNKVKRVKYFKTIIVGKIASESQLILYNCRLMTRTSLTDDMMMRYRENRDMECILIQY